VIQQAAPLRPGRAAKIARQIAQGLEAAHARGLIHRDLKPRNIMIVDGCLKILDFGLVANKADPSARRLTRPGMAVGTPSYMAPEQIMGSALDPRVDLYALGVILCEMLSGKPPFSGDASQLISQHLSASPPTLREHGGLGAIATRLLQKQPSMRPSSAREVIALLDDLGLEDDGSEGKPTPGDLPVPIPSLSDEISVDRPGGREAQPLTPDLDQAIRAALGGRRKKAWLASAALLGGTAIVGIFLTSSFGRSNPFDRVQLFENRSAPIRIEPSPEPRSDPGPAPSRAFGVRATRTATVVHPSGLGAEPSEPAHEGAPNPEELDRAIERAMRPAPPRPRPIPTRKKPHAPEPDPDEIPMPTDDL
jgi:serine/threonine protein kinase